MQIDSSEQISGLIRHGVNLPVHELFGHIPWSFSCFLDLTMNVQKRQEPFFFFLAYVLLYFPYDWVDILQMLYDENETSHYKEQQHLSFYLIFNF